MYTQQFLLTKTEVSLPYFSHKKVKAYNLYCGPNLSYAYAKKGENELYLLGSIYDWERPELTNQDIAQEAVVASSFEELTLKTNKYCGEFVIIFSLRDDEIYLFNDACAQKEIYYDTGFSCFGSQPRIIGEAIELIPHDDQDAKTFYQTALFKHRCLFPGNSTHKKNIKHLLPNHFIHITKKKARRFFPVTTNKERPLDDVAGRASRMIKGFVRAISLRGKTSMAVTGGYDSRVLFLASLDVNCAYFVFKYLWMKDNHHDIVVPKKLTEIYDKRFEVIPEAACSSQNVTKSYAESIDFPRFLAFTQYAEEGMTYINGNVCEIARNYFGYHTEANAGDLCFLNGFKAMAFPSRLYDDWLQDKALFEQLGYNYLDMFYWEERIGNWLAKSKTEAAALNRSMTSPFNCRDLLTLLLSVKRGYRDSHFNKLFDCLIMELSENNRQVLALPINPSLKQDLIRLSKRLRLYNTYRHIGLKTRLLNL